MSIEITPEELAMVRAMRASSSLKTLIEHDEYGNIHHAFSMPEACPDPETAVRADSMADIDNDYFDIKTREIRKREAWTPDIERKEPGKIKRFDLSGLPEGTIVSIDGERIDLKDPAAAEIIPPEGAEIVIIPPGRKRTVIIYHGEGAQSGK